MPRRTWSPCRAQGISREGTALDLAVDLGIVNKTGAWYTYEGEQLGQGRENAKNFLFENPEVMVEISDRILVETGIAGGAEEEQSNPEALDPDDLPISLD